MWATRVVGVVLGVAAVLPANSMAAPSQRADYRYETPVQQSSPWPTMRRDRRNTAASPVVARYRGDRPWAFRTGKGIFSTPIVGGDGTVYVGSADTYFYAISPRGRQHWRFKTGNLIDSAGFIGPYDARLRTTPVVVPSGDEYLYKIRSDKRRITGAQRVIWKFTPPPYQTPGTPQVDWWEGNAEPAPDGTILAGSTGNAAWALNPDGTPKWVYRSIAPFWTDPAIELDGTTYWGSLDLFVRRISPGGKSDWALPTLGFVVSSPALSKDGTLYIGSFDSNLYAINAASGRVKWTFPTGDHIYSSPALDDATGTVYIASTDGQIYAIDASGKALWTYDTGDVIRSSPVLGVAPDGRHKIVYVGAGNGTLYAINAHDGTRRWSYDTTRADPVLKDRNDLNASPALTERGVVIGGEDGYLKYVPYDYCLHRKHARCETSPGGPFASELTRFYPDTAGGNTLITDAPQTVGDTAVLAARMVVRRGGRTRDAAVAPSVPASRVVTLDPPVPFTAEYSGDGKHIFVVPSRSLTPGQDYALHLHAPYTAHGLAVGNMRIGGTESGTVDDTLHFRVAPSTGSIPFSVGPDKVSTFRLTRLSFPLPAFLPSVNQIGFDAYDLAVGALRVGGGRVLLWALGARPGPAGTEEADPTTPLAFPLEGSYHDDSVMLSARNATLTFSFGPVPVQRVELRAQLTERFVAKPGADIYAEVDCLTVPIYGPVLPTQRLCNDHMKLIANGTFVTGPYKGAMGTRPDVTVDAVTLQRPTPVSAGAAEATLHGTYPADHHWASIVLVDAATGAPVGLDYKANTQNAVHDGNIARVTLKLPAGTTLPQRVTAYVVADVFPLAQKDF